MNERDQQTRVVRVSVACSLLALFVMTCLAFVGAAVLHSSVAELEHREVSLFDNAWRVRYLDEALTHSASEYILSHGVQDWRVRYDTEVSELNDVIRELKASNDQHVNALDQVSAANDRLVELEAKVFALTNQGKYDEAHTAMTGEYTQQKRMYRIGVDAFLDTEKQHITTRIRRAERIASLLRWLSLIPGLVLAVAVIGVARVYSRAAHLANERAAERTRMLVARETDQRVTRALELAQTESEIFAAVRDVFVAEHSGGHVEMLLADSSQTHLRQVLSTDPTRQQPGCAVASPHQCPSIRRGTTMTFTEPSSYSSCPHLRSRELDGCKATCVPVSLMGQTVGVLHALTENALTSTVGTAGKSEDTMSASTEVERFMERVANQVGDRVGVMRTLNQSKLQAATDPLTGLLNRRSVEHRVKELSDRATPFSIAFFDLDNFKMLNDTHGHETGDRALRLFAKTLRDSLRTNDLICRWGGEEFVVVLPEADTRAAQMLSDRVRESLVLALLGGSVPQFTTSVGVAQCRAAESLLDSVARADAALLQSKAAGRDRVTAAA